MKKTALPQKPNIIGISALSWHKPFYNPFDYNTQQAILRSFHKSKPRGTAVQYFVAKHAEHIRQLIGYFRYILWRAISSFVGSVLYQK